MGNQSTLSQRRVSVQCSEIERTLSASEASRKSYLEQILLAFHDILDYDDIHQAAKRLELVQEWIRDEAKRAARDPIFEALLSA